MSNADYHADFSAISKSMLTVFMESRRTFQARFVTRTVASPDSSDAMRLGSLAHAMLLEPEAMEDFIVIPKDVLSANGARTGGKWKAFADEHDGRTLLTQQEFDVAQRMVQAVADKCGQWFKTKGLAENAIYWKDEATGLDCKCKPDYLLTGVNPPLILDFKTAASAMPKAFRNAVRSYRYDLQDAHYSAGVQATLGVRPRFLFVVVAKEPPHQCRIYEIPEYDNAPAWSVVSKESADFDRMEAMKKLAGCYASGDWSDPGENTIYPLYYEDCQ